MKPRSRAFGASAVVTTVVAVVVACDSDEAACQVDTDCPQGTICRDARCGPVAGDASTPIDSGAPSACAPETAACNTPDECCSRICTSGRCASSTPPPLPTCRGSLELCQNDCCAGFTCTAGVCR